MDFWSWRSFPRREQHAFRGRTDRFAKDLLELFFRNTGKLLLVPPLPEVFQTEVKPRRPAANRSRAGRPGAFSLTLRAFIASVAPAVAPGLSALVC